MNIEDIDNAIAVLEGLREGKTIQFLLPNKIWKDRISSDLPNFNDNTFRVKPEPREFWMKLSSSWIPYDSCTASVKMTADHGHELIKVREVIEDNIDNDSYEVTNKMKGIGG